MEESTGKAGASAGKLADLLGMVSSGAAAAATSMSELGDALERWAPELDAFDLGLSRSTESTYASSSLTLEDVERAIREVGPPCGVRPFHITRAELEADVATMRRWTGSSRDILDFYIAHSARVVHDQWVRTLGVPPRLLVADELSCDWWGGRPRHLVVAEYLARDVIPWRFLTRDEVEAAAQSSVPHVRARARRTLRR